jgi:hypothetical protein
MKDSKANRYQGMTKRQYKYIKAKSCSEPGKQKTILCQASPLEKAMIKYPRSIKTSPEDYFKINLKKDLAAHRNSFFTRNA